MEKPTIDLLTSENLGAVVIGLSISLVLCGVVILQGRTFYQRSERDPLFLKIWAAVVLVMELIHSCLLISMTYRSTIFLGGTSHGPNSSLLAASVIPEVLVTALVQGFFALRIFRLSGTLYIGILCWTLSLLRLGGGLALVVEGFIDVPRKPNTVTLTSEFAWLITLVFVVGAFVDILIAACLCYYLQRLAPGERLKSTSELIDRLMLWAVQTGLVTSATSVAIVISFHLQPQTEIWFAIYMVTTKLYSNSFFASLNVRRRLRTGRFLTIGVSGVQFCENMVHLQLDESSAPYPQEGGGGGEDPGLIVARKSCTQPIGMISTI